MDLGVGLWAWPLPLDFDHDGDIDLVVSCPDVPFNGTYFFENTNLEVNGIPVLEAPKRIGAGHKNLQISHVGGVPYLLGPGTAYQAFTQEIFDKPQEIYPRKLLEANHEKIRFSQWKYVDYDNDGDLDLMAGIDDWTEYGWDNAFNDQGIWTNGPLHGYVYLLEHQNGHFMPGKKILAGSTPIDVYGAPSPCMEDFDNDGDLDLICGEFLDRFTYFENSGSRQAPRYSEGEYLQNELGVIRMDLEMITPSAIDWDQDGDMDLICGDEDGRVALIENTGRMKGSMPLFKQPVYFKQRAQDVKFGALVTPYSIDWDDDGDEDLICGNTAGYLGFIENLDGSDPPSWAPPQRLKAGGKVIRVMAGNSGSIQGPAESKWGYTTLSVADWDGDGLNDIITNSIWGKVEWYKNAGSSGQPNLLAARPVHVTWSDQPIPKPTWNWWDPAPTELATQWRTTPVAIDWNADDLMDLVMLDHEGYLTYYQRYVDGQGHLTLKPGKHIFYGVDGSSFSSKNEVLSQSTGPLQLNAGKYGRSGRRKWCFTDWDQDGDLDIIVNSLNAALFEHTKTEGGISYFAFRGNLTAHKLAGHTTSPTVVDWNRDEVPDLVLGAEDGFLYHLKNPRSR